MTKTDAEEPPGNGGPHFCDRREDMNGILLNNTLGNRMPMPVREALPVR